MSDMRGANRRADINFSSAGLSIRQRPRGGQLDCHGRAVGLPGPCRGPARGASAVDIFPRRRHLLQRRGPGQPRGHRSGT